MLKLSGLFLAVLVFPLAAAAQVPAAPGAAEPAVPGKAPPPAAVDAPAPAPEAVPLAKSADGLAIGPGGYVKLGLLLQGWYSFTGTKGADGATGWKNGFRLRRAEIHVKGDLIPKRLSYGVMIDPTKVLEVKEAEVKVNVPVPEGGLFVDGKPVTDAAGTPVTTLTGTAKVRQAPSTLSILQDFWITVQTDWADVSIGQFKIPVSWEGFNSSGALIFAERALVSREFGDKRDLGVKVEKKLGMVYYNVSLFNGAGLNSLDMDNRKDIAGRLEITPIKGLMIGGAFLDTLRTADAREGAKDRWEADLRLDMKPVIFQAEYHWARNYDATLDTMVPAHGFYAALAWNVIEPVQVAARVGYLDEDVRGLDPANRTRVWEAGAGLHWMPLGHNANLKLDWFFYEPKTATKVRPGREHQVVLAGQVRF